VLSGSGLAAFTPGAMSLGQGRCQDIRMTLGDGDDWEPGWGGRLVRTQQSNSVKTKSSNSASASRDEEGKAAVSEDK